ncbi:hypothetical protein BJQ90_01585 [Arthrobacter sp. SO3]|nr:hypothetical protein [Arthrobacter sp. SO3]
MDKLIPVQGVGHPTSGGKKLHESVIFPDFSAFQMTISGAAGPYRSPEQRAGNGAAEDPASDPHTALVTGPAPGINRGREAAPPFSWLGSDAWPNFPLGADKRT